MSGSPEILVGPLGAAGDTKNHDASIIIEDRVDDAPITDADAMDLSLKFFHTHRPWLLSERPDRWINALEDIAGKAVQFTLRLRMKDNGIAHGLPFGSLVSILGVRGGAFGMPQVLTQTLAPDPQILHVFPIERLNRFADQRGQRGVPFNGQMLQATVHTILEIDHRSCHHVPLSVNIA